MKIDRIIGIIHALICFYLGWAGESFYNNDNYCNLISVLGILATTFLLKEIIINYFHEIEMLESNNDPSKLCNGWKNLNGKPKTYDYWKIKPKHQLVVYVIILVVCICTLLFGNSKETEKQSCGQIHTKYVDVGGDRL
jgi:hypothetical protein